MGVDLPGDVINHILDQLDSNLDTLKSSSLINHQWLLHAQPRLFERVSILMHMLSCDKQTCGVKNLREIITQKPRIASYFRTLVVYANGWFKANGEYVPGDMCALDEVEFIIPKLWNLKELHIMKFGKSSRTGELVRWDKFEKRVVGVILGVLRLPGLKVLKVENVWGVPVKVLDLPTSLTTLVLTETSVVDGGQDLDYGEDTSQSSRGPTELERFTFSTPSHNEFHQNETTASVLRILFTRRWPYVLDKLQNLSLVLRQGEEEFAAGILCDVATSLKGFKLRIDTPDLPGPLLNALQNLVSLRSVVIKFTSARQMGDVCALSTRLLGALVDCPLTKVTILLNWTQDGRLTFGEECCWGELESTILQWANKGTLHHLLLVGCIRTPYGSTPEVRALKPAVQGYLGGLQARGLLRVVWMC